MLLLSQFFLPYNLSPLCFVLCPLKTLPVPHARSHILWDFQNLYLSYFCFQDESRTWIQLSWICWQCSLQNLWIGLGLRVVSRKWLGHLSRESWSCVRCGTGCELSPGVWCASWHDRFQIPHSGQMWRADCNSPQCTIKGSGNQQLDSL